MSKEPKTYKQLKDELDVILEKLQASSTTLDEALVLHKDGKELLKQLETYLEEVEEKVKRATKD